MRAWSTQRSLCLILRLFPLPNKQGVGPPRGLFSDQEQADSSFSACSPLNLRGLQSWLQHREGLCRHAAGALTTGSNHPAAAPVTASSNAQNMIKTYHFIPDYADSFSPALQDCNDLNLLVKALCALLFVGCGGGRHSDLMILMSSFRWIVFVQSSFAWCTVNLQKQQKQNSATVFITESFIETYLRI